jgi:hypothetical protein
LVFFSGGHSIALLRLAITADYARSLGEMMKSLADVGNFFRSREPAISSVRLRVASALSVFVSIRGLEALLDNETAVVMREGYETLVIQNASAIETRENVLAVVHVKDMGCYDRLTKIQTNHFLHRRTLDRTISNDLADEMAKRLLKKVTTGDAGQKVVSQV